MSELRSKVAEVMKQHPGLGLIELGHKLKMKANAVDYQAKQLMKAGKARRERAPEGLAYVWYYDENATPMKVSRTAQKNAVQKAAPILLPIPVPSERPPEKTEKPTSLDILVAQFVSSLAGAVIERMKPLIVAELGQHVQGLTQEIAHMMLPSAPKEKLKRIFIGGLLPEQAGMLKQEFKDVADLRFANVEEGSNLWKSNAATAEHTILMVNFISHKHQDWVESAGAVPILISGGLTKLRDKVMELVL